MGSRASTKAKTYQHGKHQLDPRLEAQYGYASSYPQFINHTPCKIFNPPRIRDTPYLNEDTHPALQRD